MEVINLGAPEEIKVSNSIPGIELLMNDKKKEKETITLSDIDSLENELNNLSGTSTFGFGGGAASVKFDLPREESREFPRTEVKLDEPPPTVKFDIPDMKLNEPKWEGFKPFQGNPDKPASVDSTKDRFTYLRKLEALEAKGVKLTRRYTMDSSLDEMKGEYENIIAEKEKSNNVKFQGKMLMACITGIEFLNSKFDPFDIKLDGWAEQVNENITEYDEIFEELHEKYRNKAKLAPELKLLFQLGGSAIMLHMTNTMFKSSIPGIDDIMRQNPELMQKFTQAAVSSMGTSNPGFSGFMNAVQPPREPTRQPPTEVRQEKRPDMKGPSDIQDILSGLKPKVVQMDEVSTVSLSELNEMNEGLKKGRRKKSDKINLSI